MAFWVMRLPSLCSSSPLLNSAPCTAPRGVGALLQPARAAQASKRAVATALKQCPQPLAQRPAGGRVRQAAMAACSPLAVLVLDEDLLSLLPLVPNVISPESCPPSSITILP